jgi:hypothetical protein
MSALDYAYCIAFGFVPLCIVAVLACRESTAATPTTANLEAPTDAE